MKHHDPHRPIGKCKGCCLNLKASCAAGFRPKAEWDHGKCRHFDDQALLAEILSRPAPNGAKLARLHRKAKAERTATEPHYNGVLDPGKMAGRAKRRHG